MIRFSIFGIPVEVQPFFWVVSVLMSGGLYSDSREGLLAAALFVVAAFVSILVHELGHALTGRKLGGGYARIALTAFGGLAYNEGGRFTRLQRFWVVAMGPGAGFGFLIAIIAGLSLVFGAADVISYTQHILFRYSAPILSDNFISFLQEKPFIHLFLRHLLWINFWWGIINLLPVIPLDGGRITELFVRPQKRVYQIGVAAGGAMALYAFLALGSIYTAGLFGFLAWQNYKALKENPWQ